VSKFLVMRAFAEEGVGANGDDVQVFVIELADELLSKWAVYLGHVRTSVKHLPTLNDVSFNIASGAFYAYDEYDEAGVIEAFTDETREHEFLVLPALPDWWDDDDVVNVVDTTNDVVRIAANESFWFCAEEDNSYDPMATNRLTMDELMDAVRACPNAPVAQVVSSAEAMSYGVRCDRCGQWETACACEPEDD
jgi:hypothetical protein